MPSTCTNSCMRTDTSAGTLTSDSTNEHTPLLCHQSVGRHPRRQRRISSLLGLRSWRLHTGRDNSTGAAGYRSAAIDSPRGTPSATLRLLSHLCVLDRRSARVIASPRDRSRRCQSSQRRLVLLRWLEADEPGTSAPCRRRSTAGRLLQQVRGARDNASLNGGQQGDPSNACPGSMVLWTHRLGDVHQ